MKTQQHMSATTSAALPTKQEHLHHGKYVGMQGTHQSRIASALVVLSNNISHFANRLL
jgi:hypothetical protein